jgi:hypothetical protein
MSAIDASLINELLAGARTKGAGDDAIESFLEGGEAGIEISLDSGPFAGKTAAQAATSLNNAKKRTKTNDAGETVLVHPNAGMVQVIKRKIGDEERVFLIDKSKVGA